MLQSVAQHTLDLKTRRARHILSFHTRLLNINFQSKNSVVYFRAPDVGDILNVGANGLEVIK